VGGWVDGWAGGRVGAGGTSDVGLSGSVVVGSTHSVQNSRPLVNKPVSIIITPRLPPKLGTAWRLRRQQRRWPSMRLQQGPTGRYPQWSDTRRLLAARAGDLAICSSITKSQTVCPPTLPASILLFSQSRPQLQRILFGTALETLTY